MFSRQEFIVTFSLFEEIKIEIEAQYDVFNLSQNNYSILSVNTLMYSPTYIMHGQTLYKNLAVSGVRYVKCV